jgi:hypothetical protein
VIEIVGYHRQHRRLTNFISPIKSINESIQNRVKNDWALATASVGRRASAARAIVIDVGCLLALAAGLLGARVLAAWLTTLADQIVVTGAGLLVVPIAVARCWRRA